MMYLDTNVIIYAIENHPVYGKKCRDVLKDIEDGKLKACSSFLVLIELINVLARINNLLEKRKLDARKNIEAVTSLPIVWLELNLLALERASEYGYKVSGVDYVHIALMELNMVPEIISADRELDKVGIIKRLDPLAY
ncbi:MAG: type II toxin-antitoxin system VapC family toxin [Candidatus Aenigmarchaeota archaeon]|nr:type II toxin-antitoxin system VapC family toxin [Candidatus Aenigmarchaeota archaeon]